MPPKKKQKRNACCNRQTEKSRSPESESGGVAETQEVTGSGVEATMDAKHEETVEATQISTMVATLEA